MVSKFLLTPPLILTYSHVLWNLRTPFTKNILVIYFKSYDFYFKKLSLLIFTDNSCPCPEIPKLNLTNLPQQGCFKIGDIFRYKCKDGYLRQVGTSNLIRCNDRGAVPQWSEPWLVCIRKYYLLVHFLTPYQSEKISLSTHM